MMPLGVWEKRQRDLSVALKGKFDMVVECGKLLDNIMEIWTSLQEDPNILNIEEELLAKKKRCDDILVVVKTLPVL